MPGEEGDDSFLSLLLQGSGPRQSGTAGKRNPLYAAAPARPQPKPKSRSLPTSPVGAATKRAPKASTSRQRRAPPTKIGYKPLPGLEFEVLSKASRQLELSLRDFSRVDNLIFPCNSAPCSPSRPAFGGSVAAAPSAAAAQLNLATLRLTSPPSSPPQPISFSARGCTVASPSSTQRHPLRQPPWQPDPASQSPESIPSPGYPGSVHEAFSCSQPLPDVNPPPLALPRQLLFQQPACSQAEPISLSLLPELSAMQISPLLLAPQQQQQQLQQQDAMDHLILEPHQVAQTPEAGDAAPSPPLQPKLLRAQPQQQEAAAPACSPALSDVSNHSYRCGPLLQQPATAQQQGAAGGMQPCSSAARSPPGSCAAAQQPVLSPPSPFQVSLAAGACRGGGSSSPGDVQMEEAPCRKAECSLQKGHTHSRQQQQEQKEGAEGEEGAEPPLQRRRHELGNSQAGMLCGARQLGDGGSQHVQHTHSEPIQQGQRQQGEHEAAAEGQRAEVKAAYPPTLLWDAEAAQQQQLGPLQQGEATGASASPARQDPSQQAPLQQHPSTGMSRQELTRRRAAEDAAVDLTCPLLLRAVLRPFPTQKEAFAFADRCNSLQPLQQEPAVLMSRLAPPSEPLAIAHETRSAGREAPGSSAGGEGRPAADFVSDCGLPAAAAQQQQQQHGPLEPGEPPTAQQQGSIKVDFLSRYAMGGALPATSHGYHTTYSRQESTATEARGNDRARLAARELYRDALKVFRPPEPEQPAQRPPPCPARPAAQEPQPAAPVQQHGGSHAMRGPHAAVAASLAPARLELGSDMAACSGSGAEAQAGPAAAPPEAEGQPAAPRLHEEPVRVFCLEKQGRNGVHYRQFVAASYPAVWREYRRTPMTRRHWYEVIREGRPCHLYFDLECPAACNPGLDMDSCVNCLLHHVDELLGHHFGLAVDYSSVYELDSSTDVKLSRHLLLRIPGHAFATNHAMGQFVAQVIASAGQELMVVRSEGDGTWEWGSIVDAAVYSRNRHFRMVWSCKGGKAAVLVPTRRFATQDGCGKTAADVFLDALICRVDTSDTLLQMPNPIVARPSSGRAGGHTAAGEPGAWGVRVAWKHDVYDGALSTDQTAELKQLAERAVPFIEDVASQRAGGQPAKARTLAFCGYQGTVAYSMIGPGSHYCENIGRCHQSNHVFFVVNFNNGMFSQKCHDPDCYHFRSAWMPLPPEFCLQPPDQRDAEHAEPDGRDRVGRD